MTPDEQANLTKLVGVVADEYGRLTEDGVIELALMNPCCCLGGFVLSGYTLHEPGREGGGDDAE